MSDDRSVGELLLIGVLLAGFLAVTILSYNHASAICQAHGLEAFTQGRAPTLCADARGQLFDPGKLK